MKPIRKIENPGRVLGSKAIYYKIIDSEGKIIKVYKGTFDLQGNLVHRKDKQEWKKIRLCLNALR